MSVDLAAILIGSLAIVVSVIAGMYAASAISSEYVAKITSRLIAMERKVDLLIDQQNKTLTVQNNGIDGNPQAHHLLEQAPDEELLPTRSEQ